MQNPPSMRSILDILVEDNQWNYIEKFWINTATGTLEMIEEDDPDHERHLPVPDDGEIDSFDDAIAAGWVRGGIKIGHADEIILYLQARDQRTVSQAVKVALNFYSPEEVRVAWEQEFAVLGLKAAATFARTGRIPRNRIR